MIEIIKNLPESFKKDIENAVIILKKYDCSGIYIFGSIVNGNFNETSDIDIAVKGIRPELFFKAYSELSFNLNHSIDLINMDTKKKFSNFLSEIKEIIRVA